MLNGGGDRIECERRLVGAGVGAVWWAVHSLALRCLVAFALLTSCQGEDLIIDTFPIRFERSTGPVLLAATVGAPLGTEPGDARPAPGEPFWLSIDTLSPVSVVDPLVLSGELEPVRRRDLSLTLIAPADAELAAVPRARLDSTQLLALHPCAASSELCELGTGDNRRPIGAILGADLLSRNALRVDFAASELRFLPDVSGNEAARGRACEAVFSNPFRGGGTLRIGGAEVPYSGRRIAVGSCAAYDPDATTTVRRGVDLMLILSTGTGSTLLSESGYARYRLQRPEAPALETLPTTTVWLPSGPVPARLGTIEELALVSELSTERGPCQELYANQVMRGGGCDQPGATCVCTSNDDTFCRTGSAVEPAMGEPLEVAIIADDSRVLQALRNELRPALPEVDGILGTRALAKLAVDIDYPHARVIMRCADAGCRIHPAVLGKQSLPYIAQCAP